MTVTTYQEWVNAGEPWAIAPWCKAFGDLCRSHGYTVYYLGDSSHLKASTPEDHTPYSHTPWPGIQPYPTVMAMDIMPGGDKDWRILGTMLRDAKNAGASGTDAIKYMNWTDLTGAVRHSSWEPDLSEAPSSDGGHIHISVRTDRYTQTRVYDPWNPTGETEMQNLVIVHQFDQSGKDWLTNGVVRREITNADDLANTQWLIGVMGGTDTTSHSVSSLVACGVDVATFQGTPTATGGGTGVLSGPITGTFTANAG